MKMEWSLFVDTDSLYLETKRQFGTNARLDYMALPLNIIKNMPGVGFFREKIALVMRHGDGLKPFWDSLKSFGYIVIPTDKGMQQITIGTQVMGLAARTQGIALVAAGPWLQGLAEQLLERNNKVVLVTFPSQNSNPRIEVEDLTLDGRLLYMGKDWLWKQGEGEPVRKK